MKTTTVDGQIGRSMQCRAMDEARTMGRAWAKVVGADRVSKASGTWHVTDALHVGVGHVALSRGRHFHLGLTLVVREDGSRRWSWSAYDSTDDLCLYGPLPTVRGTTDDEHAVERSVRDALAEVARNVEARSAA